jgi:hypothetical protein
MASMMEPVLCLECRGKDRGELHARSRGNDGECSICGGSKLFPRNLAYAYHIGGHGDNLLFKSKKRGETATCFNVLADAVARLAFFPGGVRVFGMEFEVPNPVYVKRIRRVWVEAGDMESFVRRMRNVVLPQSTD